jgi:hypothetical protein
MNEGQSLLCFGRGEHDWNALSLRRAAYLVHLGQIQPQHLTVKKKQGIQVLPVRGG